MARLHHINGWMRKYKEMGDKKNILETDNRIQFLRTVADMDQSKIDIINEYMERIEGLGHFSEVKPNNATLARCIRELEAIQELYEKEKSFEMKKARNKLAYERYKERRALGLVKCKTNTVSLNKDNLRKLIKEKGVSVRVISEEMGYGETRLQGVLGQKRISEDVADTIAAYFNIPVERITL